MSRACLGSSSEQESLGLVDGVRIWISSFPTGRCWMGPCSDELRFVAGHKDSCMFQFFVAEWPGMDYSGCTETAMFEQVSSDSLATILILLVRLGRLVVASCPGTCASDARYIITHKHLNP